MMLTGSLLRMEYKFEYVIRSHDHDVFYIINGGASNVVCLPKLSPDGFITSGDQKRMRMKKIKFTLLEVLY